MEVVGMLKLMHTGNGHSNTMYLHEKNAVKIFTT